MKVLVSGLGFGHDFNLCETCWVDYSWLIHNPSVLLWADKIIFPQFSFEEQLKNDSKKFDKGINIVLNLAKENNLIDFVNIKDMYNENVGESFSLQAENDRKNLLKYFPDSVTSGNTDGIPGEILINGASYCQAYIASINASLFLSQQLNANCLFNNHDYNFLKYKFGYSYPKDTNLQTKVFDEVFATCFPNELVLHNYAFEDEEHCLQCANYSECKKNYLSEIEKNMNAIIQLRDTDELCRAKEELQKIVDSKLSINDIDIEDVKKEYKEKQTKINRNIKKVFPLIKRWTNITSVVATTLTTGAAISSNPTATAVGAVALGTSKIINEAMKYYENKNKWVGFINNPYTHTK